MIYTGESGTPYEGHSWLLFAQFSTEFPQKPPTIRFVTPFYHCNVNNDGKICHDILSTGWTPDDSIVTILEKISAMIKVPNALNSLDTVKGSLFVDNKAEYLKAAREWSSKYGRTGKQLQEEYSIEK